MARPLELDELVEHWTLLDDERELVAGKRGATRLGFSLLLKFYTRHGRFPRGRAELAGETVDFVARQVGVPPEELGLYEWTGRTTEYHRAQIRQHLGFQECSTADADKLTAWLAEQVAQAERRPDRVRQELLARCRTERIEPPAAQRIDRIVRSALHQAEQMLSLRIASRLAAQVARRLEALVVVGDDEDGDGRGVLALVKSVPGNVSLETMLTEIGKLEAWARWWPAGLAWALLLLVLLGLAATAWLDRLLRQASLPELTWLHLSNIPQVVAAVSAATVGAVLAARRPRHPVGWLLLGLGLSLTGWGLAFGYTRYGWWPGRGRCRPPATWPGSPPVSP